jgi:hypothetical protein
MGCKWSGYAEQVKFPDQVVSSSDYKLENSLLSGIVSESNFKSMVWQKWSFSKSELRVLVENMTLGRPMESPQVLSRSRMLDAGLTYLGQMVTHDIVPETDQADTENEKDDLSRKNVTPRLNLDSVIWPVCQYQRLTQAGILDSNGCYVLEECGSSVISSNFILKLDFKRHKKTGKALIPDARNDNNVIVSQLHVVWLKLFNSLMNQQAKVRKPKNDSELRVNYCQARKFTIVLFQRVVVDSYLQSILSLPVYNYYFSQRKRLMGGADFAKKDGFIPNEFSSAMFRFGHTMIRQNYELNCKGAKQLGELFRQNKKLDDNFIIDWNNFFPLKDSNQMEASGLDLKIASDLKQLTVEKMITEMPHGNFKGLAVKNPHLQSMLNPSLLHDPDFYDSIRDGIVSSNLQMVSPEIAPKNETGLVNLIVKDIEASALTPTAGDLMRLLRKAKLSNRTDLYPDLGIPSSIELAKATTFDLHNMFEKSESGVKVDEPPCPQPKFFNSDNSPLWLFSLKEASTYPLIDLDLNGGRSIFNDRLGSVTSSVIAEVMFSSIENSEVNYLMQWRGSNGPGLADSLGYFASQYLEMNHNVIRFSMKEIFNIINA